MYGSGITIKTIIIFLFLSIPGFSQEYFEVPLYAEDQNGKVIWASAEEVSQKSKGKRFELASLDMFPSHQASWAKMYVNSQRQWRAEKQKKREPAIGCYASFEDSIYENEMHITSFRELVTEASAIYLAEVVGMTNGFFRGCCWMKP